MSKRIVYCAPSAKLIDKCAHQICEELSHTLCETYGTPDVIWGFAEYLKVVAAIAVKQSNEIDQAEFPKKVPAPVD